MKTLGVIPAAGIGERWNLDQIFFKEFLVVQGQTLLGRTIEAMKMGGADEILIITNEDKITEHAAFILHEKFDIDIVTEINKDPVGTGMWGSMKKCFNYDADRYLFAMPDTYYPLETFYQMPLAESSFIVGAHMTNYPERFGVWLNKRWVNKKEGLDPDCTYFAWGTLAWSQEVVELWKKKRPRNYTAAINLACREFKSTMSIFNMDYYYDMATPTHYAEFLEDRKIV